MEFCKDRVFTSLNADELKAGDKVVVADDLDTLKLCVKDNSPIDTIRMIGEEDYIFRFGVKDNTATFALAYLVERKENCTNCGKHEDCGFVQNQSCFANLNRCEDWKPKTEQKAEKHYRPFKDTDELIKVWDAKIGTPNWGTDGDLTMPHIWVRSKENKRVWLINDFDDRLLDYLFTNCEFLDGSVCGVEE